MTGLKRLGAVITAIALAGAFGGATLAGGAKHASATFVDASGATIGWAKLVEDGAGRVHVNIHVKGLPPGLHGIHIHSVADCMPFADAGGHYNPLGHEHGLDNPSGPHAGDLPISSSTGMATVTSTRSPTGSRSPAARQRYSTRRPEPWAARSSSTRTQTIRSRMQRTAAAVPGSPAR